MSLVEVFLGQQFVSIAQEQVLQRCLYGEVLRAAPRLQKCPCRAEHVSILCSCGEDEGCRRSARAELAICTIMSEDVTFKTIASCCQIPASANCV
jgi:hypothetical protein